MSLRDFNIVDGTLYQFNTRVEDDLGDLASGISTINYLGDMSAPIVGQTLVSGFNIYNNYINGSGLILGGIATDSVSDINTESCVITTGAQKKSKNATAYWSGNHCEMEFTSVSGQNYTFNSSVEDNMGNRGYGTATIEYTADGDSPVTTATGINNTWNNINTTILLSCDDSNKSGCKETEYRLDSGDWEVYVNGILINTDLNHKIEYYSLDNVDNNEAINTHILH